MPDDNKPADTGNQQPWHQGVADAETLGHWQNKGWDTNDPKLIAVAATKAHREAERLIGAPASEMIRIPKATDEAGIKAMWQRLGVPADVKDYDFPSLKTADGKVVDADLDTALRTTFNKVHVTKDAAAQIAADVVKHFAGVKDAAAADHTAKLAEERAKLAANWGANHAANLLIAQRAAGALKLTPEVVVALEKAAGYAATMDALRDIGTRIGEAKFINGDSSNPGVMTRDQAVAKKAELMADKEWSSRYQAGGTSSREFREMQALLSIMGG